MGANQAAALAEHSRKGMLTEAEKLSGRYSRVECRFEDAGTHLPYCIIAPDGPLGGEARLPTILAISGDEQHHVEKFFRSWRAEARVPQWQVVIPVRASTDAAYFHEEAGVEIVEEFSHILLDDEERLHLPYGIEDARFHLVGMDTGAAAALALAAFHPDMVESLTLVTGFWPSHLHDLSPLEDIPDIRIYVGELDELRQCEALLQLVDEMDACGVHCHMQILPGAGHFNIDQHIDMFEFWDGFEQSRRVQPEVRTAL